jgi:hypothetical protein
MADAKKRGDLGKVKSKPKSKKKSSKKVHEIHVRRAKTGHLIAKHIPEPGEMPTDEEHVIPEGGMDDHIAQHMPPDAAQAAPAPQPGSQMMGGM